jgi:cytochrome c peroxidase
MAEREDRMAEGSQRSKYPAEDSWRGLRGKLPALWERMPRLAFMFDVPGLRKGTERKPRG